MLFDVGLEPLELLFERLKPLDELLERLNPLEEPKVFVEGFAVPLGPIREPVFCAAANAAFASLRRSK